MKIAICDIEIKDRERIKQFVLSHDDRHEIAEFHTPDFLLKCICAGRHFDVLFMDIQMPDSDGWETAVQLKKANINIYIAIITMHTNYIYDCFDRADWFAAKPVSEAKIHQILNHASDKAYPELFEFIIDKVTVVLTAWEIIYIEVKRNDSYIHTVHTIHKIRRPFKNITKQFDMSSFASPHQSYLINLAHCETIKNRQVVLKNGEQIPLSRNKSRYFYNAFREYIIRRKRNE